MRQQGYHKRSCLIFFDPLSKYMNNIVYVLSNDAETFVYYSCAISLLVTNFLFLAYNYLY